MKDDLILNPMAPPGDPGHEHSAPLIIDTRFLRPLPKAMWGAVCVNCDKAQSMWEMGPTEEPNAVCSLCFLYESKWAEKRLDDIHGMVRDVEAHTGEKMLRGRDNVSLISAKDGNKILGALAMTSRMFQLQDKLEAVKTKADTADDVGDEANEADSGD
jgi:hypothetical protein